jgi:hypothetical protein
VSNMVCDKGRMVGNIPNLSTCNNTGMQINLDSRGIAFLISSIFVAHSPVYVRSIKSCLKYFL